MNGPVIFLSLVACAGYIGFMSLVGRCLAQSREQNSIPAGNRIARQPQAQTARPERESAIR